MASLNPIRNLLVMSAVAITTLITTACGLQAKDSAQKQISALDRKAEKMKQQIRNTPSAINLEERGTIYYISAEGDDSNSGLSPEQAIHSLEKLNSLELKPNDCVLFRRGDLWRGRLRARTGVSYSAYGKGEKPRIYGSPYDAAKVGRWVETEAKNVYMYDGELSSDIGTLVFNHGEANAFKVMKIRQEDGSTLHIETREPFASYRDLKRDLEDRKSVV